MDAVLPPHILVKSLDDNGDDVEDVGLWDKVAAAVATTIDGYLAPRYALPLASVPKLVSGAALTLAAEMLYDRAGFSEERNPWAARARAIRDLLKQVASGGIGIGSDFDPSGASGTVTETSKTYNGGRLMV